MRKNKRIDKKGKLLVYRLIDKLDQISGLDLTYFIKNGFWVVTRGLVAASIGLFISIIFTRLTSKELYGNYQFILATFSLVSVVSLSGLDAAILRSVAHGYEGSYLKAVKTSFLWSLLGIIITFFLGIFYLVYKNREIGSVFLVSSVLFPFLYGINHWQALLSGQKRFDVIAKLATIQSLISGLIMALVISRFRGNLTVITLAYFLLTAIFNVLFYKKSLSFLRNNKEDRKTISYGYFLTKINLLSILTRNIDKIIIGTLLGPSDLAVYAVGTDFSGKLLSLTKSFLSTATPKIAQKNVLNLKILIKLFIFFSVVGVMLCFLTPFIIRILFSEKYANSIVLSQIVIIFLPFYVLNLLYKNHVLFYLGDKEILLKESVILPLIKIILIIPLLAFWKTKGLAFLVGFQNVLDLLILWLLLRLRNLEVKKTNC